MADYVKISDTIRYKLTIGGVQQAGDVISFTIIPTNYDLKKIKSEFTNVEFFKLETENGDLINQFEGYTKVRGVAFVEDIQTDQGFVDVVIVSVERPSQLDMLQKQIDIISDVIDTWFIE